MKHGKENQFTKIQGFTNDLPALLSGVGNQPKTENTFNKVFQIGGAQQ